MPNSTDKLIESFASKLRVLGVPIREDDNKLRLASFEKKLPKRPPQSFASLLSHYSFRAFDVGGISLFEWDSDLNAYTAEACAAKGSLSEVMLPAGFAQIGRPDTGSFDAICFDLNEPKQNREYRIVQIDHEEILCNWRVRVTREPWSSFVKLIERALSSVEPMVHYEDPRT